MAEGAGGEAEGMEVLESVSASASVPVGEGV
jgi:hypothetical protein